MPDSPEIRQEVEEERRELKQAVAELRGEIDETTKRGKQVLVVAAGAAVAVKLLRTLNRRRG